MRAFGYIRVSTGQQAKKHSLDAQQEEIQRYCAQNGIEVLAGFEDHLTGKKLVEREGLMEMLDRAGGEVDLVVATESDRISRDTFQFGWIATHLSMQGVDLRIINERPAETPVEKAFQKMRAVFAEFETDLRQWRINRGRARARAKNQFMNRPPLGYAIRGRQLVVDPEGRDEVVGIFQVYGVGESMAAIARCCGRDRRTISYILKNRFYIDPLLHGEHEIFLKKGLFECAQIRLQGNGSRTIGITCSQKA